MQYFLHHWYRTLPVIIENKPLQGEASPVRCVRAYCPDNAFCTLSLTYKMHCNKHTQVSQPSVLNMLFI